jgi:hypothetical protein
MDAERSETRGGRDAPAAMGYRCARPDAFRQTRVELQAAWRIGRNYKEDFVLRAFRITAALLAVVFVQPSLARPDRTSSPNIQERSADFSRSYLRTWSSARGAAPSEVNRTYAPRVRFYGRTLSRRELAREKERFARRWPVRRYSHQPGTMRVSCRRWSAQQCMVRSVINWRTANPTRRARSAGSSRFEQGIQFSARSARPLVFHESGSVVSKRKRTSRG